MPDKGRGESGAAAADVTMESSDASLLEDSSSVCSTSTVGVDGSRGQHAAGRRRRRRGRKPAPQRCQLEYRCSCHVREAHGLPLFGVQFNPHLRSTGVRALATCGGPRLSLYELDGAALRLVQCYADPDPDENFYTCAWSYEEPSGRPLIAVAGARGVIRVVCPASMVCVRHFIGHGHAVNELKFHPRRPAVLLSISKDHTLRLWNVATACCLAILGGVEGHRDEVLSADFNLAGEKIISCGMDHSLKLWDLTSDEVKEAVEASYTAKPESTCNLLELHFPEFSTRDIHRNYVDCVRWFGKFVLSKSCENSIVCWKPGLLTQDALKPAETNITVIHMFDYKDCDIWFMRFSMDYWQMILALGNQVGRTFVWDLAVADPTQSSCAVLSHPKCNAAIRQTAVSPDGATIVCVCDDATVWRWDRV